VNISFQDIKDLRAEGRRLRRLVYEANHRAEDRKLSWKQELEDQREIAQIYRELDEIVLLHASITVDEILYRRTHPERATLDALKSDWLARFQDLTEKHPDSLTLQSLQASFTSLEGDPNDS